MMTGTLWRRRSENDNTPQPLDQWTNSPFMGQQVGNCKSSILTHLLADVFAMQAHCTSNIVSNSHLFHSESIDLPIPKIWLSKFSPENPRSRSWVRSKVKVTTWVQHPKHSHPFGCMSIHPLIPMIAFKMWPLKSKVKGIALGHIVGNILSIIPFIGPPVPEIQLFQKFTLKIQGQGHRWGQSSKSQCKSNILSTHIPLIPCLILNIQGRGHSSRSQSR